MDDRGQTKEEGPEKRDRLDKIDPKVRKKYKALEKALIHEFIDDHVDLRDRYLKKSLELQMKVFGAEVERHRSKFRVNMTKEPPPVPPRTSTRLESRRKSRSPSPNPEFNDRFASRIESPDEADERSFEQKSSSISVNFTDNSDQNDHREKRQDRCSKDRRCNRDSHSRPRSSKPSEKVKELSSDLFQTISEKQQEKVSRWQQRKSPIRKNSSDTIISTDSIAFSSGSSRSDIHENQRLPSGKSRKSRLKSASLGNRQESSRRISFANRSREGRWRDTEHSECSLHEVDQRHRQKRHNVTKSSIATRWSSNITRDLSPYRRRMNHTATPDRTRDALHEMSRYSAISARHERSSPRRNYSEVQDRPIRQNSGPRSSMTRPKSSMKSFSDPAGNHSGVSPQLDASRAKHFSLPTQVSGRRGGGVSHRLEDSNEENISKWLELKEMEMAKDKWEKKARKLLTQKKKETETLSRAKREDDSKMAYDKWFKEKSKSIRVLEKKLSETGIESTEKAEMQSKNDECFKTWLRQKNSQKRKEREAERQRIERESTQELKTEAERRKAFNDWLKNKERSLRTEQRKKKQLEREALATELENISSRSKEASAQETQNSECKKLSFLDEIVRKSEEETGATKNLQTDKTPGGETKEGGEMEESQEHQKNSTEKETEVDDSVHSDENEHQLVNDFSTFGLT